MERVERGRESRAELRAWYLGSLFPQLVGAADAGTVTSGAVDSLDKLLRELLDLPEAGSEEAAFEAAA